MIGTVRVVKVRLILHLVFPERSLTSSIEEVIWESIDPLNLN